MIKINLLPTKKKPPKKVIDLQQQLLLAILVLVLLGIGMTYFYMKQSALIARLEQDTVTMEAKVKEQDDMLKEVKNVEDERAKVAEKIGIIEKLKKNQAGPVRILDEISSALPQSVNLTALVENDGKISLEGEAFSNDDVVRFVEKLKASRYLAEVALQETTRIQREGVDFYKYKLQFVYKGL